MPSALAALKARSGLPGSPSPLPQDTSPGAEPVGFSPEPLPQASLSYPALEHILFSCWLRLWEPFAKAGLLLLQHFAGYGSVNYEKKGKLIPLENSLPKCADPEKQNMVCVVKSRTGDGGPGPQPVALENKGGFGLD